MRVRLTRKLAGHINGVDLRAHNPGDVFDISPEEGGLLIAEGWAIAERRFADRGESARRYGSAAPQAETSAQRTSGAPVGSRSNAPPSAQAADRQSRRASDGGGEPNTSEPSKTKP